MCAGAYLDLQRRCQLFSACVTARRPCSRSTGVGYRLVHLQPPVLYVLRKERRESGQDARTLGSYYILDGTIFQAPTVEHVITSRIVCFLPHHCSVSKWLELAG